MVEAGDLIVTDDDHAGLVTLVSKDGWLDAAIERNGAVITVRLAHEPTKTRLFVIEGDEGYNFCVDYPGTRIKEIRRGKKVIFGVV